MSTKAPKKSEPDRLLTYEEIAERCGVTPRRVRRWCEDGKLEFVQLPRGRRVRKSALNAWLRSRIVPPEEF